MVLCMITLIAPRPIRNHSSQQERNLHKAHRSLLTTRSLVTLTTLLLFALCLHSQSYAQGMPSHPQLRTPIVAIHQTLQAPSEQLVECSLESLLEIIAAEYKISLWCDRRIAKDTLVRLEPRSETLESLLNRALKEVDAGLVPLDGVLMVAPLSRCDAIEAAHWRLVQSRAASALLNVDSKPFSWPNGTVASQVIESYQSRFLPRVTMPESIEHDIWKAFEFRKATPATIGICLFTSFDLCLADEHGTLQVIDLPIESPSDEQACYVEWVYPAETIKKLATDKDKLRLWKAHWPKATTAKNKNGDMVIQATVSAHRELIRPRNGKSNRQPRQSIQANCKELWRICCAVSVPRPNWNSRHFRCPPKSQAKKSTLLLTKLRWTKCSK
jgi:hypothetical protein